MNERFTRGIKISSWPPFFTSSSSYLRKRNLFSTAASPSASNSARNSSTLWVMCRDGGDGHEPWCNLRRKFFIQPASCDSQNTTDLLGLWHGGRKLESWKKMCKRCDLTMQVIQTVRVQEVFLRLPQINSIISQSVRKWLLITALLKCVYCCCWRGSEMCGGFKPEALCFILKKDWNSRPLPFVLSMSLHPPGSLAHPLRVFGL